MISGRRDQIRVRRVDAASMTLRPRGSRRDLGEPEQPHKTPRIADAQHHRAVRRRGREELAHAHVVAACAPTLTPSPDVSRLPGVHDPRPPESCCQVHKLTASVTLTPHASRHQTAPNPCRRVPHGPLHTLPARPPKVQTRSPLHSRRHGEPSAGPKTPESKTSGPPESVVTVRHRQWRRGRSTLPPADAAGEQSRPR